MEYFIEYSLYFLFTLLIIIHQIFEFRRIEKPKKKSEFIGLFIILLIATVVSKKLISHMSGDEFLLTHTFNKIINLYVNP